MDFGFGIAPSASINLDKVDLSLYRKVREIEPDIDRCMACGSCSATCPAARFSGMSVRKVILGLQKSGRCFPTACSAESAAWSVRVV